MIAAALLAVCVAPPLLAAFSLTDRGKFVTRLPLTLLLLQSLFSTLEHETPACVLPAAVTAAKPASSGAADNASAAAPEADAAEIEAVRLAALASMNKHAGGAQDALGLASKQAAGLTPVLRLRPTIVQQVCEALTVTIFVHQLPLSSISQVHHVILGFS